MAQKIHPQKIWKDDWGRKTHSTQYEHNMLKEKIIKNTHEIDYRYSEDKLIEELTKYIDATYGEHYAQDKIQSTEFIIDGGHGTGFCIGNIMKYSQRYGKKDGWNRKDLLKVLHYGIIALHVHEEEHGKWAVAWYA